jgi:toxin FitB
VIILDTNVVSELMRRKIEPRVLAWADAQAIEQLFLTAMTVMEIRLGIAMLPIGRRQTQLERDFDWVLNDLLSGRVISFDIPAAELTADWTARARRQGSNLDGADAQIAGIALSRTATLATRNTHHFDGSGLNLVDPWIA